MKSIFGFFMAWGMFTGLPCPLKIWNEKYRKQMLIMLPLVGLMLGSIWFAAVWAMTALHLPVFLTAAAATALPFFLTGSIHTDGYMDVMDAVFSRRDIEERRRILKDSANGSFAMIGLVIYVVLFFGAAASVASGGSLRVFAWAVTVPSAARLAAVIAVVSRPPLPGSQYSNRGSLKDGGTVVRMVWQTLVLILLAEVVIFVASGGTAAAGMKMMLAGQAVAPAAAFISAAASGRMIEKNLGGMSGDISGAMITIGELAGMICCALFV